MVVTTTKFVTLTDRVASNFGLPDVRVVVVDHPLGGTDEETIVRWADAASEEELARGMSVPAGWDPYFAPWMSRRDLLEWAPKHYRHHRAQLTISKPEAT